MLYNELYQLKVDVDMLNAVKIELADVSSVSPHCCTRYTDVDQHYSSFHSICYI